MADAAVAVGTIITKSYLPFARTLARSLRALHPDIPVFVLLVDTVDGFFEPADETFELIPLQSVAMRDLWGLCFRYPHLQVGSAMKPHLLRHLLGRGFDAAVFLDADILVVRSLDRLFSAVREHAVVVTPHLLSPPAGASRVARELNILQSGVYNGGFVGVSNRSAAHGFLAWWEDRLATHCRHAVGEGMHNDQRWLDLVPTLFDDVHVFRDEGCNVAYWNIFERDLARCRFFHFSGFDPERPTVVTRYFAHPTMEDMGGARWLFERYGALLHEHGLASTRQWPYAYQNFDNGVPIPDLARHAYRDMGEQAAVFGDPFSTGLGSYYEWLNETPERVSASAGGLSRLWDLVYQSRADLRAMYPDVSGADRASFHRWVEDHGRREHDIDGRFAPEGSWRV